MQEDILKNKKVLLIIGGGIAAYKSLDLIRKIKEYGANVKCVLTDAAKEFVTPLSVKALSNNKVYTKLFDKKGIGTFDHIELSKEQDIIIVAPATANLMARFAHGEASDLASTILLATKKPIFLLPSMNVRMWENQITKKNVRSIKSNRNIKILNPIKGSLACGEFGKGKMIDSTETVRHIVDFLILQKNMNLSGVKALVTAGPTIEKIDPIRCITNLSSGKQGYAIAETLYEFGADTTLVTGPTYIEKPSGINVIEVETAREMLQKCENNLPVDVAICSAAVADFQILNTLKQKIKKNNIKNLKLELKHNPDILKKLSRRNDKRPKLVVGFAAETKNTLLNAKEKLKNKGCDWLLANKITFNNNTMGSNYNSVYFLNGKEVEKWERENKKIIAEKLVLKIGNYFSKYDSKIH